MERIDDIPIFSEAFDHLTKFYAGPDAPKGGLSKKGKEEAGEIALTQSDDGAMDVDDILVDEAIADDGPDPMQDLAGNKADPVGLAAGLPCKLEDAV